MKKKKKHTIFGVKNRKKVALDPDPDPGRVLNPDPELNRLSQIFWCNKLFIAYLKMGSYWPTTNSTLPKSYNCCECDMMKGRNWKKII